MEHSLLNDEHPRPWGIIIFAVIFGIEGIGTLAVLFGLFVNIAMHPQETSVYFSSFIPILRWRGVPTYIVTDILGLLMLGLVPGLWKMHPRALRALVIVQIVTVANELTMSLVLPDAGGAAAVQRFLLQAAILIALLIYFAIHTRLRTALFVRRR